MSNKRGSLDGLRMISLTVGRTYRTFRQHKLGRFVPFFVVLLFGALILWIVNAIAPLAPFVYSLF